MHNLASDIATFDKQISSLTKEEYFFQLCELLKSANQQGEIELLNQLLLTHIPVFIISPFRLELLSLVEIIQPLYLQHPSYLAVFYCLIGHVYFYADDARNAKKYYRKSISFATEYKLYGTGSSAMVNYLECDLHQLPTEHLHSYSKIVPLYTMTDRDMTFTKIVSTLGAHIQTAIELKKFEYVENLLNYLSEKGQFSNTSREHLQFNGYRILSYKKQERYREAIDLLNQTIQTCLQIENWYDFVTVSYRHLKEIYEKLHSLPGPNQTKDIDRYLKKHFYLNTKLLERLLKNESENEDFKLSKKSWIDRVDQQIQQGNKHPLTLVVVDIFAFNDTQLIHPELRNWHNVFQQCLPKALTDHLIYNTSTLYYVLEEEKNTVDEMAKKAIQIIGTQLPIYFITIDISSGQYTSVMQAIDMARAVLYYQFLH